MDTVKIARDDLLVVVKKNRASHRQIFEEALIGYRDEVIRQLEQRLDEAKRNKRVNHHISLIEPMDQTKEYDRIIKMLEMSVESEIELTQSQFAMYVMDDWSWKQQFTASNVNYSATLRNSR